jgi:hypothetical protein
MRSSCPGIRLSGGAGLTQVFFLTVAASIEVSISSGENGAEQFGNSNPTNQAKP